MITNQNLRSREIVLRRQEQRASQGRRKVIAPAPTRCVAPISGGSLITCITPTGDRPLAFTLCRQWMLHQTVKPDQWIVVDDGKIPTVPIGGFQYVRREPQPGDPKHTLDLNLMAAFPLIRGDKVFIIEDDEYYAPRYIEEMAGRLDRHEIVGIVPGAYYHLPTGGYHQMTTTSHASLAETAFRNSFLPEWGAMLKGNGDTAIDLHIWTKVGRRGRLFADPDRSLFLGMKGLPGRSGIGIGHNPTLYGHSKDTVDRAMLKKWVAKDYQVYLDILSGKLTSENYQSYFPENLPITGITVCWNTRDLIERAYNSIRKFYPEMPIVIIDGSDAGDPCAAYVHGLVSDKTTVISLGYNIGHGRGMCMGIDNAKTPYALIFDSDIEILKPCLPEMLAMMEEDTFGVGDVDEKADFNRFVHGTHGHVKGWVRYLQPYFQLIDIGNYRKFYPYVHHGAPCYLTMLDIYKRGLSGKILKQFPGLIDGVNRAVKHDFGGTGTQHIERPWVTNEGLI